VGDLFGTRESKYAALAKLTANSAALRSLEPEAPNFFFRPEDNSLREEYETWWSVPVAMPFYNSGLQTKRDELTIHHRREDLERVLSDFRSHDTEWLRRKYELGPDGRDWTVALAKKDVRGQGKVIQLQYRPFDFRFTYFTGNSKGFLAYPRRDVSERILAGSVALVTMRQIAGVPDECEVFVTRVPMTDRSLASTLGTPYLFPLMSMRQGEDPQQPKSLPLEADGEMHNFSEQFLAAMRARLGNGTQPHPMTILNYMYGIFHSPSYRSRYSEFLKIAFPRFPLPSSLALFGDLARLGGELVTLHLMESTKIDNFITAYIGPLRPEVKRVSWSHDTVWLDATATSGRSAMPGTIGFRGVPEAVWNFRVGGYKVCERWLKDRKDRTLSKHDIAHYQKIIVALAETIRLMNEIDQVIEAHGGWPGAFDGKVEASRARKSEALA
jgi:predicted helicase